VVRGKVPRAVLVASTAWGGVLMIAIGGWLLLATFAQNLPGRLLSLIPSSSTSSSASSSSGPSVAERVIVPVISQLASNPTTNIATGGVVGGVAGAAAGLTAGGIGSALTSATLRGVDDLYHAARDIW